MADPISTFLRKRLTLSGFYELLSDSYIEYGGNLFLIQNVQMEMEPLHPGFTPKNFKVPSVFTVHVSAVCHGFRPPFMVDTLISPMKIVGADGNMKAAIKHNILSFNFNVHVDRRYGLINRECTLNIAFRLTGK